MSPLLYIAPRGLITVLLFFAIESQHPELVWPAFNEGVLLVVILTTALAMTAALIQNAGGIQPVEASEIGALPSLEPAEASLTTEGSDDPEAG